MSEWGVFRVVEALLRLLPARTAFSDALDAVLDAYSDDVIGDGDG